MAMFESVVQGKPAYTETLPRLPESAGVARALVSSALRIWGLDEAEYAAHIVVSELVSNAVAHARRESIRVTVVHEADDQVQVSVVDLSRQLPQRRPAGQDDEGGRGLALVAALTDDRWGAEPLRWGKRVWANLTVTKEIPSAG